MRSLLCRRPRPRDRASIHNTTSRRRVTQTWPKSTPPSIPCKIDPTVESTPTPRVSSRRIGIHHNLLVSMPSSTSTRWSRMGIKVGNLHAINFEVMTFPEPCRHLRALYKSMNGLDSASNHSVGQVDRSLPTLRCSINSWHFRSSSPKVLSRSSSRSRAVCAGSATLSAPIANRSFSVKVNGEDRC